MPENPNRGSSFEDFLKEEGILEASTTTAVKRVLAWQIARSDAHTASHQVGHGCPHAHQPIPIGTHLLDPEKTGVSLETIHVPLPS